MQLQLDIPEPVIQKLLIISQETKVSPELLVSYWVNKAYAQSSKLKEEQQMTRYSVLGDK